jgi:hypothetical protein
VDEGAILATYKLKNQDVLCSLGHRHKEGQIVCTRCGIIYLLGPQCAEHAVKGHGVALAYYKAEEKRIARVGYVQDKSAECTRALRTLLPRYKACADYQEGKHGTDFGREMLRRATLGWKGSEVVFEVHDMNLNNKKRVRFESDYIDALEFWTTGLDVAWANSVLERAEHLTQDFDVRNVELIDSLYRRAQNVDKDLKVVREHVELGERFRAEANLKLAVKAANLKQAGAKYVVEYR